MEPQKIALRIENLAKSNGISINKLLSSCSLGKSVVDNLKKGSMSSVDKIAKIADYFGVSTDYLLTGSDNKKSSDIKPKDDVPEEFILMARKTGDIPPEQRKRLYKFLDSTIDNFLEALKDEQFDK